MNALLSLVEALDYLVARRRRREGCAARVRGLICFELCAHVHKIKIIQN